MEKQTKEDLRKCQPRFLGWPLSLDLMPLSHPYTCNRVHHLKKTGIRLKTPLDYRTISEEEEEEKEEEGEGMELYIPFSCSCSCTDRSGFFITSAIDARISIILCAQCRD